jgi:hypothetical protein
MKYTNLQLRIFFLFLTVPLSIFFLSPLFSYAQDVQLQIPIGNTKSITVCSGGLCHGLALYIVEFAKWLVGALSMLAVIAMMFGGLIWLTSRASQKQVVFAKKLILDSLVALGGVLGAYLLLSVISPDLVNFKNVRVETIEEVDFDAVDWPEISETPDYGTGGGAESGGAGACNDVAKEADVRSLNHSHLTGKDAHGKLCKDSADALEKAAEICKKKYNQSIPLTDTWRSLQEQEDLFKKFGPSQACNPHKYPGKVTCPHVWGNAIDITIKTLNDEQYKHAAECLKEAGWCRLTGGNPCESWHFEYPRRSKTACIFDFNPLFRGPKGKCER